MNGIVVRNDSTYENIISILAKHIIRFLRTKVKIKNMSSKKVFVRVCVRERTRYTDTSDINWNEKRKRERVA